MPCDKPHDAQVTHTFELPDGPFEAEVTRKRSETGCQSRQDRMFARHRSPVPVDRWYLHPSKETWGDGDRQVTCYVVGKGGRDLPRSVVPPG